MSCSLLCSHKGINRGMESPRTDNCTPNVNKLLQVFKIRVCFSKASAPGSSFLKAHTSTGQGCASHGPSSPAQGPLETFTQNPQREEILQNKLFFAPNVLIIFARQELHIVLSFESKEMHLQKEEFLYER